MLNLLPGNKKILCLAEHETYFFPLKSGKQANKREKAHRVQHQPESNRFDIYLNDKVINKQRERSAKKFKQIARIHIENKEIILSHFIIDRIKLNKPIS